MQPNKPQIPIIIWIAIIALLLMGLITNFIAARNPSARSYPQQVKVVYESIDYNKITSQIKQQVAALPLAKAGANGKDGKDGQPGKTGATGAKGAQGVQGSSGAQGEPGAAGKSIEIRFNATKNQIEWRYTGDFGWITLITTCTLTNTCGP